MRKALLGYRRKRSFWHRFYIELPLLILGMALTTAHWLVPLFGTRKIFFWDPGVDLFLFWIGFGSIVGLCIWIKSEVSRSLGKRSALVLRGVAMFLTTVVGCWNCVPLLYERLTGDPAWSALHPAYLTNIFVLLAFVGLWTWSWWPLLRKFQTWTDESYDATHDEWGRPLPTEEERLREEFRELLGADPLDGHSYPKDEVADPEDE